MPKKYQLTVKGDWNDADYHTEVNIINEKTLKALIPIFNKMKKEKPQVSRRHQKYGHREWEKCFYTLTNDEKEFLQDYFPHGYEDCDIHTIESITVTEILSHKTLY